MRKDIKLQLIFKKMEIYCLYTNMDFLYVQNLIGHSSFHMRRVYFVSFQEAKKSLYFQLFNTGSSNGKEHKTFGISREFTEVLLTTNVGQRKDKQGLSCHQSLAFSIWHVAKINV